MVSCLVFSRQSNFELILALDLLGGAAQADYRHSWELGGVEDLGKSWIINRPLENHSILSRGFMSLINQRVFAKSGAGLVKTRGKTLGKCENLPKNVRGAY